MFFTFNESSTANNTIPPVIQRMSNPGASNMRTFPPFILLDANTSPIDYTNTSLWVNPVSNVTSELITICTQSSDACNGVIGLETLQTKAYDAFEQTTEFLMHTNRLCGKTPAGTDPVDRPVPYLVTVANIGRSLSYIKYVQENIVDDSLVIENFGSAYQYGNLVIKLATVDGIPEEILSSIVVGESSNTTTLTPSRISQMVSAFNDLIIFVDEKRVADETAFANSLNDIRGAASGFINTIASAQANMINNYTQTT